MFCGIVHCFRHLLDNEGHKGASLAVRDVMCHRENSKLFNRLSYSPSFHLLAEGHTKEPQDLLIVSWPPDSDLSAPWPPVQMACT